MSHRATRLMSRVLFGTLLLATAAGCKDGGGGTEPEPEGVQFSLADTLWMPAPGDTVELEVRGADGKLISPAGLAWRSLSAGVASVTDRGIVTAVAAGEGRVVAESGRFADTVTVKVMPFATLAAGAYHSCGTTPDGALHCWGGNAGPVQLLGRMASHSCSAPSGLGDCEITPVRVPGVPAFARSVPGFANSCGLTAAGQGWCWGANAMGTAGTSPSPGPHPPKPLLGGVQLASMALTSTVSCGLTPAGAAYCWGGSVDNLAGPQPVLSSLRFTSFAAGPVPCGIPAGSTNLFCYRNGTPVQIGAGRAWTRVVAKWQHYDEFCALDTAGAAWCWKVWPDYVTELEKFSGDVVLAQLAVGRLHGCGLTAQGKAYCWGWNLYGQLGRGTAGEPLPVDSVAGGLRFREISVGEAHTCGLTLQGLPYCWGEGRSGQVGNSVAAVISAPVRVSPSRTRS